MPATTVGTPLLSPVARWEVADILSGVLPPQGASPLRIAYKTGTSYGYRDAWSVGFDGRHVIGVWVGRPDGSPVPGLAGYVSAAPILFDAFARSGVAFVPLPGPPAGALRQSRDELARDAAALRAAWRRHGQSTRSRRRRTSSSRRRARRWTSALPPATESPLVLKLQGGRAPFRWLANGRPLASLTRRRTSTWLPDGAGFSTLTVIDAAGRAASVKVFVE